MSVCNIYMRINSKHGFIEWEVGTGGNHEITQIKTYERREGYGKQLMQTYLDTATPPFYSVYAFVLAGREGARGFYKSCGFEEVHLGRSVYRDDDTILVWRKFL